VAELEDTSASQFAKLLWVYFENGKNVFTPLQVNHAVEHQHYYVYGIAEAQLQQLWDEMERSTNKRRPKRLGFEIPAVGITSKDVTCPVSFIAGQGLQVVASSITITLQPSPCSIKFCL